MVSLNACGSYECENRACGSGVFGIPDVAENSPSVASEKQQEALSDNT